MRLVYVAGKFSGPDRLCVEQNIACAEAVGLDVARLGAFPVVPHSNTSHPEYEKVQPYQFWIDGTLELLRRCDALITVPNWKESSGARGEVQEMANVLKRPVFHSLAELEKWLAGPAKLATVHGVHQFDCGPPSRLTECEEPIADTLRPPPDTAAMGPDPGRRLFRNRAICLECGTTIESKHVHDFKRCKCHNLSVDGGLEYLRRGYGAGKWEELSEYEVPRTQQITLSEPIPSDGRREE